MKNNNEKFTIDDLTALNNQTINANEKQWENELEFDKRGNVENCIANYITYLTKSPRYKEKFKFNDFTQQKEFDNREFTDYDQNDVYINIENELGLKSHRQVDTALMGVFNRNRYNPIVDYLKSVKWDGKKRVESLFIDLLDADDTVLNRYMTKTWFIAAIKRIMVPGCKFDNMIVLQGEQGIGKSSICDLISLQYANNVSLNEIGSKDLINKLNRTWIAVVDELDSFNKKEMSIIKTFLSNQQDTARLAFAKNAEKFQRHCVFIGSTNDTTFLRDNTSLIERRFWVIKCNKTKKDGRVYKVLSREYVDQLWAEAMTYYNDDPNAYLDITEDYRDAFEKQMTQFKTFNDDVAIDYVRTILNKKYRVNDKGEFNSEKDMLEQFNDDKIYADDTRTCYITKIPYSYVRYVLKTVFHEERGAKYIGDGLGADWQYKSIRYKDVVCKGFERKQVESCNQDLFL